MSPTSTKSFFAILALAAAGEAFTTPGHAATRAQHRTGSFARTKVASTVSEEAKYDIPYFIDINHGMEEPKEVTVTSSDYADIVNTVSNESPKVKKEMASPRKARKAVKKGASHKEGVFSPAVVAAKSLLGDDRLNKIRGDVITMHSDIIKGFVATSETSFGQATLARLFALADRNGDGKLDEVEVAGALQRLGFSWLKEKQIGGIVKRADLDKNGFIEFDEFIQEAPRTLKTNLVKLAKKNGGEMGLLV
eukprot:CAMPEP_0197436706 /NCGR_PEP_ID=MMETSP1175-20131217/4137_1 /TAXON_ID=1003142 /ORGANISM="Triceratium dubium, Strain CCMP147" /LENGTH=249 /DNA_ID=CAMNT_0042966075 /DNA_START=107 /DNA_END=856 /DNA_ORIENTATION=+